MNRRRLAIYIVALIVFAAVLIGAVWHSRSTAAITVRFHSFDTNGPVRLAFCLISNTTDKDFVVSVSAEYMTNGEFPKVPVSMQPYQDWGGRSHGLFPAFLTAN